MPEKSFLNRRRLFNAISDATQAGIVPDIAFVLICSDVIADKEQISAAETVPTKLFCPKNNPDTRQEVQRTPYHAPVDSVVALLGHANPCNQPVLFNHPDPLVAE